MSITQTFASPYFRIKQREAKWIHSYGIRIVFQEFFLLKLGSQS
jgi:hypothetical protein